MNRVRIGVNLLWLVPGVVGGSEEYTTRLLRAVRDLAPDDLDLVLFALGPFTEAHPDLAEAFDTAVLDLDGRNRAQRVTAEATWLAREAHRRSVDLLHHAGGVVPPGPAIGRIPAVLTIHDLQPLLLPANFSLVKRRWLAAMLPRSAARARLVVTPSVASSASVVEHLGVPAGRVHTVPHGVAPAEPVEAEVLDEVRARYRLEGRTLLYPAITYPHKDHATLVQAFARLRQDDHDVTLVLTGGPGPSEASVASAIRASGVGERIRRTGRVGWGDLRALYALASVVTVPSRFEGFGAPALEAMAWGVPVVAADATALPWVVGDGGLLVPPGDPAAWADAITRVLDDPDLAGRLVAAGHRRAAELSWEAAGAALLGAYRAAAAGDDHLGSPG